MRAIVLAAGEGSRLRPLTARKPKPMLQVSNKPILQYVVEALVANDVTDITMVVGFHREKVQSHFENGKRFGANIKYAFQESFLGTAHALAQVEFEDEDVLVLSGDNIVDSVLVNDILRAHEKAPGELLLVAKASDNPTKYGVVTMDGSRVVRIEEKPPLYTSEFVNTAVYAIPKGFHSDLVRNVKDGVSGLTFLIDDMIQAGRSVTAVRSQGLWMDVVYPWDLIRITGYLLHEATVEEDVSKNATVHRTAVIDGPLAVGDETTIGAHAVLIGPTSIGDNVYIGAHSVIENSVIGDDVHIGPHVILKNAVIADGTRLGPRFTGLSGPADVRVRDGYHEIPDIGCIIGEDSIIGGNVTATPGTMVGNRVRVHDAITLRGAIRDEGEVL